MKRYIAIACLLTCIALWLCISCTVPRVDWQADKLRRMTPVEAMEYAKEIHLKYLKQPEYPVTGSHEWHRAWVEKYNKILKELGERHERP